MTQHNLTWSNRFPLDPETMSNEAPGESGIYSSYIVGPVEKVNALGYSAGKEELVYIGKTFRDGGLRGRLGERARAVKNVKPIEDGSHSNLCPEEKRIIRAGCTLEYAWISGARSDHEARAWEKMKFEQYEAEHDGRLPPGNTYH